MKFKLFRYIFKNKNIFQSPFVFMYLISFLAYLPMILNKSLFWDDWSIFYVSNQDIIDMFDQTGRVVYAYLIIFIKQFSEDPRFFRLLVFIFYSIISFLIYNILKKCNFNLTISALVSFLILILPLNFSKIIIPCILYAISILLFCFSFYLVLQRKKLTLIFTILVNVSLFVSFTMVSLLLIYPIIHLATFKIKDKRIFYSIINHLKQNVDHILTFLVFVILKITLFKPYGFYTDYNKIEFKKIFDIKFNLSVITNVFENFFDMNIMMLHYFKMHYFIYIIITILFMVLFKRAFFKNFDLKNFKNYPIFLILFGFILSFISVYSYALVDKYPSYNSWDSRHQILLPFGFSFMICGFTFFLYYIPFFGEKILSLALSFFCTCCIFNIFFSYSEFQKKSFKQLAIIEKLKNNKVIFDNRFFIIEDKTKKYILMDFYEWNAFFNVAFHDTKRFGTEKLGISNDEVAEMIKLYGKQAQYHMGSFIPTPPKTKITISLNNTFLTDMPNYKILFYSIYNDDELKNKIYNSIKVETHIEE